jgi:hypothetical protein
VHLGSNFKIGAFNSRRYANECERGPGLGGETSAGYLFSMRQCCGSGARYATDTLAFYMFQLTFPKSLFALGGAVAAFMIILSAFLVGSDLMSMWHEAER